MPTNKLSRRLDFHIDWDVRQTVHPFRFNTVLIFKRKETKWNLLM